MNYELGIVNYALRFKLSAFLLFGNPHFFVLMHIYSHVQIRPIP